MTANHYELTLLARAEHIDALGHVNNAVWVQWIQEVAVAHWNALATEEHKRAYHWVVIRHEIDYLQPAREDDCVRARTWVGDRPRGARFDRFVEFVRSDGRIYVRAKTQWAMIDKASGNPIRIPPEVIAPFVSPE